MRTAKHIHPLYPPSQRRRHLQREQTRRGKQSEAMQHDLEIYRNHLDAMLNTMQDAVISISLPDRKLVFASNSVEQVFGYPVERFVADPGFFRHVVHPDDLEMATNAMQTCLVTGYVELDHRVIFPDGSVHWIHRRAWINYDDQHRPLQVNDSGRDITDKKLAEQDLRKSETMFQQFMRQMAGTVFIHNHDYRLLYCNQQYADSLGKSAQDIIGQHVDDYLPPEIATIAKQENDIVLANQRVLDSVYTSSTSGALKHWRIIKFLIPQDDSPPLIGAISIDITQQYEAEKALQEAHTLLERRVIERTAELERVHNRLEAIFNHSADAIVLLDVKEGIQQANPAFEVLFECQPHQYLNHPLEHFLGNDESSHLDKALQLVINHQSVYHIEAQATQVNGTPFYVEISLAPLKNASKQVNHAVCIIRDVTERKQVQQALDKKLQDEVQMQFYLLNLHEIGIKLGRIDSLEPFYRECVESGLAHFGFERMGLLLYDNVADIVTGTYGTNRNGQVVNEHHLRFNPSALTGILQATINQQERFVFNNSTELYEDFELIGQGQNAAVALWDKEILGWLTIDNGVHHQPITLLQLDILNFYALTISSLLVRKRAEIALQQALEQERELGALKSRFVSMASHEFRTPLASILTTAETLALYRSRMDEGQIDGRLTKIKQQVIHMKDIMEDVLQLARIQAGRVEFKPEQANFSELCHDIVQEFDFQQDYRGRIIYDPAPQPVWFNFDERLMRQVVSNLIHNALKYSSDIVEVDLKTNNNNLTLTVTDKGIGIPQQDIKHLFQPFHRASNVGTISGTGLGLSITKQAVDVHGGKIAITTDVGQGTMFTITLPLFTTVEN